jgi:hypothetical protein
MSVRKVRQRQKRPRRSPPVRTQAAKFGSKRMLLTGFGEQRAVTALASFSRNQPLLCGATSTRDICRIRPLAHRREAISTGSSFDTAI